LYSEDELPGKFELYLPLERKGDMQLMERKLNTASGGRISVRQDAENAIYKRFV
jgi:hypothetical protein